MTCICERRTVRRLLAAFASIAAQVAIAEVMTETAFPTFEGRLSTEFESAYLSSSGTLCDTRPTSLQNLDWALRFGDYGRLYGYGCFLSMLHDKQHEMHRPAFNEFEGGLFYGYDWKLSEDFTFFNGAGGVWNPLFGYRDEYRDTLWEYRYFQSLENPYLTPYWDILGLLSPKPSWARIRMGVRRKFALLDSLSLTPSFETVWGDCDRFFARYGENPNHEFLGGAFITTTAGLLLEWRATERFSIWLRIRQFDTVNRQARRREREKTSYWAKTDRAIFTVGCGYDF